VSFVYALALGIGLFVVAPYLAHRLRRRRAEEREFAPARLVPAAPPRARSRARLEDRALFFTRLAAILALALLGASPLVRCSRLSLSRTSGASVAMAIVLDDSMSMRATLGSGTRFDRAREGARELLASTREGDAVAIVLAGSPARVALAATSDLAAARAVLEALAPSDRGTDLEGSLILARGLVSELPQIDRRIVVLSDLADGRPDAPPLGEGSPVPVWIPLPELRGTATDCGILSADRSGAHVRVRTSCSPEAVTKGREVALLFGDAVLAHGPLPPARTAEVNLALSPDDAARTEGQAPLSAELSGADAIRTDDAAPVMVEAGQRPIAVVTESPDEAVSTGGVPVVEQALSALDLEISVRPIPALPDRSEDLAPFLGIIIDDPKGFTPEQRRALGTFVHDGGFVLVALGPRAASAPIGASLEPILQHATAWEATSSPGANPETASGAFAESAPGGVDLGAKKRAVLAAEDLGTLEMLLSWTDGAPLFARRALGRGEAWIVTLPFAVDASDLLLRPLFLALLDAWTAESRARSSPRRTEVGTTWSFPGAHAASAIGRAGPLQVSHEGANLSVTPSAIGLFAVTVDGKKESRVAAPVEAEIDLRPRKAAPSSGGTGLGDAHAAVDASPAVAFALLLLVAVEMALRLRARSRAEAA
jgi:hypothetical protein